MSIAADGDSAQGYLALPASGIGPGVIVIQEWWGLVPQIMNTCDRLATQGFVALAPDLYHGEIAKHDEMDKAGHLMSTLPMDRAARDMGAAVEFLRTYPAVHDGSVGVVGFCMGGMLALLLGTQQGDKLRAVVSYYGAPFDEGPDWANLSAPVRGYFAENDDFFPPDKVRALEAKLKAMGKDVSFDVCPGTGHAFGNEENALGTYDPDAAAGCWTKTVAFLHEKLG